MRFLIPKTLIRRLFLSISFKLNFFSWIISFLKSSNFNGKFRDIFNNWILSQFQNAPLSDCFSKRQWQNISYIDNLSLSISISTFKRTIYILKNSGWNLMGIAHYAIRLVFLYSHKHPIVDILWEKFFLWLL